MISVGAVPWPLTLAVAANIEIHSAVLDNLFIFSPVSNALLDN